MNTITFVQQAQKSGSTDSEAMPFVIRVMLAVVEKFLGEEKYLEFLKELKVSFEKHGIKYRIKTPAGEVLS